MCDEHNVKWGTPQKLAGFIGELQSNKHLAMDFWSIVARMSEEATDVGPNRVLEVIVEGVTGRSVAEMMVAGRVERGAVSDLTRLLAGEDVWSPVTASPKISHRIAVDKDGPRTKDNARTAPADTDVRRGEDLAGEAAAAPSPAHRAHRASWTSRTSSPTYTSVPQSPRQQYREAPPAERRDEPRRLFLEPEPVLEQAPPVPGAIPPPVRSDDASTPTNKSVPLSPRQRYPVRLRSDDPSDASVRVPFAEYAETPKSRRAPVIGLLLLLITGGIVGATFFMPDDGLVYWQRFEATIRHAVSRYKDAAKENVPSSVDSHAVNSSATTSGSVDPGSRSDQTNVANENSATAAPAPATEARAATAAGAATRERMSRSASIPSETEIPRRADLVEVPAAVMQERLISSRVPVYPEAARADHVEGRVVMQAVVTKDGAIGHLHVMSGDPILRAAALEAVSAWRYRPYLVNGEPVDVMTSIPVDFLVDKDVK